MHNKRLVDTIISSLILKIILKFTNTLRQFTININRKCVYKDIKNAKQRSLGHRFEKNN